MARLLFCRRCRSLQVSVAGTLPTVCPSCRLSPARWTTQSPVVGLAADEPLKRYELTGTDAQFLHSIRVLAD